MAEGPTVHIVDDDESLRLAANQLLRSVGHQTQLYPSPAIFASSYEAGNAPACLLLDVRLPGISGLEFQQQLASMGILLPVIMMTGHGDIPMTVQAMKAGAIDFLSKPFREQALLDAVSAALRKSSEQLEIQKKLAVLKDRFDTLSPREREVMALVALGRLNKQVAGDLNISELTVKVHRKVVMQKMQAPTLAALVRMSEALQASG